jgi:hypothetical protein
MGKELYRIGDLVEHSIGYSNGYAVYIYGKVTNIVENSTDISHYEYDVVTCEGHRNSKVTISIKPLVYCKDLSYCDLDILSLDPHKVHKRDINIMREKINKKMEFLEKKLQFVNKNENRIDKLNKILDVPE